MLKKIIIAATILLCGSTMYAVTINDLKVEKITEDSAKITLNTDTNSFAYINGLKIDEVGTKQHYFYLTDLESGKEQKVKVAVTAEDGTKAEQEISFTTLKNSKIDYSKTPEWLPNQVFYEIFVRAFADSDGNGTGDFKGIADNLDYLQELGITAIWLMPINTSPSYHGYDTTNYYQVNKEYGKMEDFKKFIDDCHKRGIKVIMDLVLNHTGSDIKWFRSSRQGEGKPYRDWYVWSKEKTGAEWYPNGADGYNYYAVFWDQMPDLNYRNPVVVSEAKNIADFWLDVGVDGFRLDAAKHIDEDNEITHKFWMDWRKSVKNKNPDAIIVAENWSPANEVAPFFKEFDMSFDFDLGVLMLNTCSKRDNQGLVSTMQYNYEQYAKYNKNFVDAPFLTNHDMKRTATNFIMKNTKLQRQKQAATMLFTMGGAPFVYYGEEIGQEGNKPDENLRESFDWYANMTGKGMTKWVFPKYNKADDGISVEEQRGKNGSLLEHYKKMIALRKKYDSFRSYEIEEVNTDTSRVFGYMKKSGEEKVVILLNFNKESAEIDIEGILKTTGAKDIYNDKDYTGKISLDGEGFIILKLK